MDAPALPPRPGKLHRIRSFTVSLRHERLTKPGQMVMVGALASGIAIAYPDRLVGSLGFSFFTGLVVVSAAISLLTRVRVSISRSMPERCMAGQTVKLSIRVQNTGRRTLLDVGAYEYRIPQPLRIVDDP